MFRIRPLPHVGGHLVGIIDAADDDRTVRVALQEIDDHFLPDTRVMNGAPTLAGPVRRDSNPTGAVDVVFTFAIPVELDFYPAVLIRENLFSPRADHDRRLRTLDQRAGSHARRAKRQLYWNTDEAVLINVTILLGAISAQSG